MRGRHHLPVPHVDVNDFLSNFYSLSYHHVYNQLEESILIEAFAGNWKNTQIQKEIEKFTVNVFRITIATRGCFEHSGPFWPWVAPCAPWHYLEKGSTKSLDEKGNSREHTFAKIDGAHPFQQWLVANNAYPRNNCKVPDFTGHRIRNVMDRMCVRVCMFPQERSSDTLGTVHVAFIVYSLCVPIVLRIDVCGTGWALCARIAQHQGYQRRSWGVAHGQPIGEWERESRERRGSINPPICFRNEARRACTMCLFLFLFLFLLPPRYITLWMYQGYTIYWYR